MRPLALAVTIALAGCAAEPFVDRAGNHPTRQENADCLRAAYDDPRVGWIRFNPLAILQHNNLMAAHQACLEAKGYIKIPEATK